MLRETSCEALRWAPRRHAGWCRSVRRGDVALRDAIDRAQQTLRADGTLQRLVEKWLGSGAAVAPGP
jgi:ABC-type amino acid transport substrate-binding protein